MELTKLDCQLDLWQKIHKEYTARLQTLREKNDGDLDHDKTTLLRGQILECKKLLALEPK